jgi:transposase
LRRRHCLILGLLDRQTDITLAELRAALAEQGVATSLSSLWRFFVRRRITLEKSRRTRTSRAVPTS